MPAFILRTSLTRADRGRLSIHHAPDGKWEWKTDKFSMQSAEAEASRARFRDDAGLYCVYGSGLFLSAGEAEEFVRLVNGGMSYERAHDRIRHARVDVQV